MHVENEAPVNAPQHGKINKHAVLSGHRCPRKPPVQHLGNRHFSKDNTRLFQQDTQAPNNTQKMSGSLSSLEEPKSPKGLVKKPEAGGLPPAKHMCWAFYMPHFPLSEQDHLHFTDGENEPCPGSDSSQYWCHDLDPHLSFA